MDDLADIAVDSVDLLSLPQSDAVGLNFPLEVRTHPRFERPLQASVRSAPLLTSPPWVRSLGKLAMEVSTQGWRFPTPPDQTTKPAEAKAPPQPPADPDAVADPEPPAKPRRTRIKPTGETVLFKDRLLYLLQPPLEDLFAGKQVKLPFQPYPYQLKGIAFLMPRHAALLADEMGLGKTVQVIMALRLLFHAGLIRRALVVCPKPLVVNWTRELRIWAEDVPFEVIGGDTETRRAAWLVSNCPLKLVNYELLTRDAAEVADEQRALRRGGAGRGPAHQEPRIEDGPGGARPQPRPQLGHDRHAHREPDRGPGQHLRLRRSRPHPAGDAGQDAAGADARLHPAPDQGRGGPGHAAARSSATPSWS